MADKDFVVKNGLVVNANVLVVNGANVGVNTSTPDAVFVVAGTANLQGNVKVTGGEINVTANVTVYGNTDFKNNVYVDKKLYVGNTATMVQNLPTIIQAVDNFNGFVMVSSQNLSIQDDACADLLIYSDNTNGLTYFNDLGINNSRFDGRIHRIIVNSVADSWSLGEIVYQRNSAGANIAVGQIRDKVTVNSTAISLKIRVSEDDGLPAPLVDMSDFVNTAATNLSLYAVSSGTNADILHAVGFFSTEIIEGYSRRNYAFTVGKRGDGYLYNANSALTIGTTRGGMREITETISTSFSSGVNVITMSSGNTLNIKPDMDLTGTGIDTGTYITSVINSTAFRLSKPTTTTVVSGTITARDEFYDLSEANNPIIFHVGGMMAKNEIARFSGTGNFTIGPNTTNRNSKLTVNGTANLVGQVNVGANLNVVGSINTSANVNGTRGIFTTSVNVGAVSLNTTSTIVGNTVQNASAFTVSGNTTVATSTLLSNNLTIGNGTVTDTSLIRVQNSTSSANMTPGVFSAGISTVNTTAMSVGANVVVDASSISVGNASVSTVLTQNATATLQVTGNATISANLTTGNLIVTSAVRGQANFAGNVAISGNTNVTGNVYAPSGVFASSANIGIVSISTTSANVGANVSLDSAGLRVTGNTLIPSMNIAGGNITVGNNTVTNTPTISLSNSISSSNLTSSGFVSGGISINAENLTVNVGANVSLNSSTLAMGNSTANVVISPSDPTFAVRVKGNAIVNGDLVVKGNLALSETTSVVFSNTVFVNGDFIPVLTDVFTLGNSSYYWATVYAGDIEVPQNGIVLVGNSTLNTVTYFDSYRVSNSVGSFTNVNITGVYSGNSTSNGQYTSSSTRIGNTTANVVINASSIVIGNSSVNSTVNSSSFTGNVFAVSVNATTVNASIANVSSVNASSNVRIGANVLVNASSILMSNTSAALLIDASDVIVGNSSIISAPQVIVQNTSGVTTINSDSVSTTSLSGNLTGNVSAITISASANIAVGGLRINTTAFVGNSIATSVNASTINTTSVNATSINSTSVNATTVNATTFQVGSSFRANSTDVLTSNLTVTGNLVVTGTLVSMNTTTLDVTDLNVTVAKGVPNAGAADGAGITVDAANVSIVYSAASGNWLSNTGFSVGNTSVNVTTNSTAFVGNVIATSVSGNLIGNVSAVTVSSSSNVTIGANVLVNTSAASISNTTAVAVLNARSLTVGNGSITTNPQIVVQNSSGTTTVNAGHVSTTTFSGNLLATSVNSTSINATSVNTVSINASSITTVSLSLSTVDTSTINSTTVNATTFQVGSSFTANSTVVNSVSYRVGTTVVANTTGTYATHLGGTAAAAFIQNTDSKTLSGNLTFSGNSTFSGTNTSVSAVFRIVNTSANVFLAAANGNIGIGTTTPAYVLDVSGPSGVHIDGLTAQTPRGIQIEPTSYLNSLRAAIGLGDWVTGQDSAANSTKDFFIHNSSGSTKFTIDTSGNMSVSGRFLANSTHANATHLNGQPASYYLDIANFSGTLSYAQIPANIVNTTAAFTRTGETTFNANVILGSSTTTVGLRANGSYGTPGQVLASNGTAAYWTTVSAAGGTVSSISPGNGMVSSTGGAITTTGTLTVLAGTGITVNATGVHVNTAAVQEFASGTRLIFQQSTAPTGWTRVETENNKALRVVNGSGWVGTGGSVAFTTAFASQSVSGSVSSSSITISGTTDSTTAGGSVATNTINISGTTDSFTLANTHMPTHRHFVVRNAETAFGTPSVGTADAVTQGHDASGNYSYRLNGMDATTSPANVGRSSETGGSTGHSHTFSLSAVGSHGHSFSGTSHSHTFSLSNVGNHGHSFTGTSINLAVSYVDAIIASKN